MSRGIAISAAGTGTAAPAKFHKVLARIEGTATAPELTARFSTDHLLGVAIHAAVIDSISRLILGVLFDHPIE
jgi:hypothetical protein